MRPNASSRYTVRPFEVKRKADESPLTEADLASHRTIVDGLRELTPDVPILSEESAEADVAARRQWVRYWLVDPLDGTRDFVNGNGEFTVNIALIERHAPVLGVVVVPVTGVAYAAARTLGARRHDADRERVLSVRRPATPRFGLRQAAPTGIARPRRSSAVSAPAGKSRLAARSSSAGWPRARSMSTRVSAPPANGIRPPLRSWWSRRAAG